jgi:hypothetical protein
MIELLPILDASLIVAVFGLMITLRSKNEINETE